ncbi:MAG: LacI family DNA-binding transcriptional regulator [Puniceicoccaceae bacterium]
MSKEQKRVTLADVAAADGTHVTTVSLAMRNSPRLADKTRKRIQALAAKMGYTPDPAMQALVSYRKSVRKNVAPTVIAYLTNWTTRWGWKETTAHPDFFEGAKDAAADMGYKLEHFWVREPDLTHDRLNKILQARSIRGVIVSSTTRGGDDYLALDWNAYSAVKIDYLPHEPVLHNVTNNQCSIVRLAIREVLKVGYERIGFVMHRGWDHSVDNMFTAGFLCEQQELPEDSLIPAYIFPDKEPVEDWIDERADVHPGIDPFKQWYETWRPEVIISKASFVRPLLKEMKLRVPEDVKFVDIFHDGAKDGKLAGVRQNHHAVGALAVEILAGRLSHNKVGLPKSHTTTYVDGTWIDGASLPIKG